MKTIMFLLYSAVFIGTIIGLIDILNLWPMLVIILAVVIIMGVVAVVQDEKRKKEKETNRKITLNRDPPLTKFADKCSNPTPSQVSGNKTATAKVHNNTSSGAGERHTAYPTVTAKSESKTVRNDKAEVNTDMATVLGAGIYTFGKNIPNGTYDLTAVSGSGFLTTFTLDGDEDGFVNFGVESHCAKEYRGLSSEDCKKFVIEGNVRFDIKKSEMIEIE